MNLTTRLMKLGVILARFIPLKLADRIAVKVGVIYCYLSRERRKAIKQNLQHIFFGEKIGLEQLNQYLKRTFSNSACTKVDFFRLGSIAGEKIISSVKLIGENNLREALNHNKGCVLLTLHIGNWDYAGSFLAALGFPMSALVEETEPDVFALYTKHRERTGMKTFSIAQSAYAFLHTIKNNRILAVLADRDIQRNGVTVDFFSGKRNIPKGLAQIVIKKNLPIIFGYLILQRQGTHRYLGILEKPVIFHGTEESLNRFIVENFERIIRSYPDQWFVFQPEWLE